MSSISHPSEPSDLAEILEANLLQNAILHGVTDGILALKPGGRIIFANHAAARFFGYPSHPVMAGLHVEPVAQTFYEILDEHGKRVSPSQLPGIRALRGETVPETLLHYRLTEDSPQRSIVVKASPVLADDGLVSLAIATFQEVTEQLRLERLKVDLLNAVSHELRTPLTTIKGYAEFLEDGIGGSLSQQQTSFVSSLKESVVHLESLVDDLLDFAQIQAGNFSLRLEEVDLGELIASVCRLIRPLADDRQVELHCPSLESVIVTADRKRLMQILNNLLSNALKFTPPGGRITVLASPEQDTAHLSVTDTGIGIPEEALPHIFQKFYQVDGSHTRMFKGVGLGLSIVKSLVEAHQGTISVQSKLGQGTKFHVTLPKRPHQAPDADSDNPSR